MKRKLTRHLTCVLFISLLSFGIAQAQQLIVDGDKAEAARLRANEELKKKAADWVADLKLPDSDKEKKLADVISRHLIAVRDWNNEHPFTAVPAGINPATGNRLSELDRQIIANSAMPASIHTDLMTTLKNELEPGQVEAILDKYTIGKVAFTMGGYKAIVPDLTKAEEEKILGYLQQAREQAIDYKSMKQISAIFEIYKTKCEQYLNSNGRNWRQLYKAYVDKAKSRKEAEKQKSN